MEFQPAGRRWSISAFTPRPLLLCFSFCDLLVHLLLYHCSKPACDPTYQPIPGKSESLRRVATSWPPWSCLDYTGDELLYRSMKSALLRASCHTQRVKSLTNPVISSFARLAYFLWLLRTCPKSEYFLNRDLWFEGAHRSATKASLLHLSLAPFVAWRSASKKWALCYP